MKDISYVIDNFHNFLMKATPNLQKAGVMLGVDAWDEFTETNFRLFVTDFIAERDGIDVSNVYGQWSHPEESEVLVKVDSGVKIFIGEAKQGDTITVEYNEFVIDSDLEFHFREFKYPFADDEDDLLVHLKHVAGEFKKDGRRFHVSVPMKACKFLV